MSKILAELVPEISDLQAQVLERFQKSPDMILIIQKQIREVGQVVGELLTVRNEERLTYLYSWLWNVRDALKRVMQKVQEAAEKKTGEEDLPVESPLS